MIGILKIVVVALLAHVAHSMSIEEALGQENAFSGRIWAVLVSGSNGWYNYRHQADIFHAYQVLKKHGVSTSRIITMAYDDIANNPRNPFKGKVFNDASGVDVYAEVKIDYRMNDVTPKNFYNVLSGNAQAMKNIGSEKVVQSGSTDNIFVFIDDHGAPGIFAMPVGGYIRANDLNNVLKAMHAQRKYNHLAFYIEACESGSMFNNLLPNNIAIYATTASNEVESSYACNYNKTLNTYLGDTYAVNWMKDTDTYRVTTRTLHDQFEAVKSHTGNSHVKEYGQIGISFDTLSKFQGPYNTNAAKRSLSDINGMPEQEEILNNRDVPLIIELKNYQHVETLEEKEEVLEVLYDIIQKRMVITNLMKKVFDDVKYKTKSNARWEARHELKTHDCYYPIVDAFHERCFNINKNEFALTYLHKFVTLCEHGIDSETVINSLKEHCNLEMPENAV